MNKGFAIAFGAGLVVVGLGTASFLYMNHGLKLELPGKVLKVRTAALDENDSVAVFDFRVTNTSDLNFQVRSVKVELVDEHGTSYVGDDVSDVDATRLLAGVPVLGQKYNPSLMLKDVIRPHATVDRMIAAHFGGASSVLDKRKKFVLHIEEVDGTTFDYPER
jgi:hypothetical protein